MASVGPFFLPFFLVAAVLQFALCGVIIASRPKNELNWALGLLFFFNAVASLEQTGLEVFRLAWLFDAPTGWMVVLAGLLYPRPPRGLSRRGAAILCTVPAVTWLAIILAAPHLANAYPYQLLMQGMPVALGFVIVAVRFTPVVLGDSSDLARHQAGLLLGALAFRGLTVGTMQGMHLLDPDPIFDTASRVLWTLVLATGILAIVRLAGAARRGRSEATPPLALLLVGLGLGVLLTIEHVLILDVVSLYYLRPVVLAYALLRYQLLGVTTRVQQGLAAGTLVAGAVVAFLGIQSVTNRVVTGPGTEWVAGLAGFGGVLVGFFVLWTRGVLGHLLRSPSPAVLNRHNFEVYRAEVEDAVRGGRTDLVSDPMLRRLRKRSGIGERDHALIEFAVRAAEPRSAASRELLANRYEVVQPLGQGTYGRTLLCRRPSDGTLWAVKDLLPYWHADPETQARFRREVEALQRVRHPNVIRIEESYLRPDRHLLVMEYAEEGSLQERLARGPLPPSEAVEVARQVLAGVEAVHAAGLVHRDVKPANILFSGKKAKIADFGVARDADARLTLAGLSEPGVPMGTLPYMAPEQVRGEKAGPAADLYAVGVVLHESLTGRHYLGADKSPAELRQAILAVEPRLDEPSVPPSLRPVLRRALAKEARERFPDARAMRVAIERSTEGLAEAVSQRGRAASSDRRR